MSYELIVIPYKLSYFTIISNFAYRSGGLDLINYVSRDLCIEIIYEKPV